MATPDVRYEVDGAVARLTLDRPERGNGLTVFDGIARHAPEGHAFQQQAAREGFRAAVRARYEPFGDAGPRASGVTGATE